MALAIGAACAFVVLTFGKIEKRIRGLFPKKGVKNQSEAGITSLSSTSGSQDSLYLQTVAKFDTLSYDWLMQKRGPHNRNASEASIPEVVIVKIDDNAIKNTIDQYRTSIPKCNYPFPRKIDADLIRKLKQAGAVVIGLDMTFNSKSGYNKSEVDPDDDREFAKALKECGNVVLTSAFDSSANQTVTYIESSSAFPLNIRVRADGTPDPKDALIFDNAVAASPANLNQDVLDRGIRRFQLFFTHGDPDDPSAQRQYMTFATTLAALYDKSKRSGSTRLPISDFRGFETATLSSLDRGVFLGDPIYFHTTSLQSQGEQIELPADRSQRAEKLSHLSKLERSFALQADGSNLDGSVNICFAGYPGPSSCTIVGFDDVLRPENASKLGEWFRGKIVIAGSMLPEEHSDAQSTPLINNENPDDTTGYSFKRFGVDIHANIVHTLLSRHYYRNVDGGFWTALVWLAAMLPALLIAILKPLKALFPILFLTGCLVFGSVYLFDRFLILQPTQIFSAIGLSFFSETVYFFWVEERRANRARSTFQRYVGPKVLATVLDIDFKPGTIEKRYATILFSDVQGFTTLAEKIDPHEAVQILNRYLNQMVDIIHKYDGVLDKIMGDGIMAYFNAPSIAALAHHEQKAVLCALEMQDKMNDWRKVSEAEGLPPLKIRIGIHSGDVIVGEMGAKQQVGFTVIGDAVNTAARLEPLNKEFGSEILVSEAVKNQLDSSILTEFKGELEIRGRKEGIRAYSITGKKEI